MRKNILLKREVMERKFEFDTKLRFLFKLLEISRHLYQIGRNKWPVGRDSSRYNKDTDSGLKVAFCTPFINEGSVDLMTIFFPGE